MVKIKELATFSGMCVCAGLFVLNKKLNAGTYFKGANIQEAEASVSCSISCTDSSYTTVC